MADYYADMRSNYFRVRSMKAFDKFCKIFELEKIEDAHDKSLVGFVSTDGSGIPNYFIDRTTHEDVEAQFIFRLANQLKDGEVAIVMEIGSEKMCYLDGYAVAVNSEQKYVNVGLTDIYTKLGELTKDPTKVKACEY